MATSFLYANTKIARAVYVPNPGSAASSFSTFGNMPLWHSRMRLAAFRRYKARLLYPNPFQARITAPGLAMARERTVGKTKRNSVYFGTTRDVCVCWSMTSDTMILYGSWVWRQGRSRLFFSHQVNIFFWKSYIFFVDKLIWLTADSPSSGGRFPRPAPRMLSFRGTFPVPCALPYRFPVSSGRLLQ